MTGRVLRGRVVCVLAGLTLLTTHGATQTPFRARTEVVAVDVLVKDRNLPVTGLTAGDFELRDNGVVQQIAAVRADSVPVDLTLVLDVSSSANGLIDDFKEDVQRIAQLLRAEDQVRLLALGGTTVQVFGFQPGNANLPLDRLGRGVGETALDDALLLALAWVPEPRRRHLVAAFTDGGENASMIERQDLIAAATRAPALLHIVLPRPALDRGDSLQAAAEATGGGVLISGSSSRILSGFKTVFETFRSGYVLQYTPRGVEPSGWHELTVSVKKPGAFEIHARKGYAGG